VLRLAQWPCRERDLVERFFKKPKPLRRLAASNDKAGAAIFAFRQLATMRSIEATASSGYEQ
jgi:hypothetical protein